MKGNMLFEHCVIVKLTHLAEQRALLLELWQFVRLPAESGRLAFHCRDSEWSYSWSSKVMLESAKFSPLFLWQFLYSSFMCLPVRFPLCKGIVTFSSPQHFAFLGYNFFRGWYINRHLTDKGQWFILRKILKKTPFHYVFFSCVCLYFPQRHSPIIADRSYCFKWNSLSGLIGRALLNLVTKPFTSAI